MQFEDAVRQFIALARDLTGKDVADYSSVPQLREYLEALSEDTVVEMLGVMYVGRGDLPNLQAKAWRVRVQQWEKPEAISQMLGKSPLVKFLEEGLGKLDGR